MGRCRQDPAHRSRQAQAARRDRHRVEQVAAHHQTTRCRRIRSRDRLAGRVPGRHRAQAIGPGVDDPLLRHVGVGRDDWPDTGSGAELYVVIGQAPRQLDRNIVRRRPCAARAWNCFLRCRAARGALGFYATSRSRSARSISAAPWSQPMCRNPSAAPLEVLRTDTPLFTQIRRIAPQPPRRMVRACPPATSTSATFPIPVRDIK